KLAEMGRRAEEIAAYDDVVGRFGTAREPALCEQVGWALWNKAIRLGQAGRLAEEIAAYDEGVARFGAAQEQTLRDQVSKGLLQKAKSLEKRAGSAATLSP